MIRFDLIGLDGANPLGFLAAIGTLRTASAQWEKAVPKMGWHKAFGGWRPYLELEMDHAISDEELVEGLDSELSKMREHPAFAISDDLALSPDEFRAWLLMAYTEEDRTFADFLAAFGSEALSEKGQIADTALRNVGAGHQRFIKSMRQLAEDTEKSDVQRALFASWRYEDGKPSMRWDPNDDRRYALRWKEPSTDIIRTVRGANRLAIEALPLLPTMVVGNRLETTGFTEKSRKHFWTWPIWEPAVSIDIVRSILALDDLQLEKPNRWTLGPRGIVDVFRCQRITQGKYRNFTTAVSV